MKITTVNIAFKDGLLKEIDKIAREESRSRSELIREATRAYIENKNRWNDIFNFEDNHAAKSGLTPEDISGEIKKYLSSKRN